MDKIFDILMLLSEEEEDYDSSENITSTDEDEEEEEKKIRLARFILYRFCILIASIVIVFILMMMEKRKSCCLKCLGGYFALIIPVNFIENRRDRLVIISAFAISTLDVFEIIFENNDLMKGVNVFLKALIRILLVLVSCFLCLPCLICFTAKTYTSLCLGILYTIGYMTILILDSQPTTTIQEMAEHEIVQMYSNELITIIFGVMMIIGYIRKIYQKVRKTDKENISYHKYQKEYLKELLTSGHKIHEEKKPVPLQKVRNCCQNYIYYSISGFRYSLSLLVSITVGLVAVSHVLIHHLAEMIEVYIFIDEIFQEFDGLKDIKMPNIVQRLSNFVFNNVKFEITLTMYDFLREQLAIIMGSIMAAIITAYLLTWLTVLHMLKSYRKNVLSLFRRKQEEHILKMKGTSNVSIVVSAVQYAGYQVAYLMWGAHIQLVFLSLVYIMVCEIIVLPFKYAFVSVLIDTMEKITPILLIMAFTKGIQFILVKYVFLQEKGALLALDNRKGFYTMMFFMFFYNIFMGVFSCLLRIIKAILFGIWFLPRLDRSIFPRTFERFDNGFKAYTNLLKLESIQGNVIVVTFVNSLLHKEDQGVGCDEIDDEGPEIKERSWSKKRHLARNRWFVAYTLIRNPSLIEVRHPNPLFEPWCGSHEFETTV